MLDPLYPNFALYGAPGVGKSTARGFFNDLGFRTVSFAGYHRGGLRDIITRLFGPEYTDNRQALNWLGMGARDFDADVWIKNAMAEVDRVSTPVVMDDMRGENEWQTLGARGFVRVHILADDVLREQRLTANNKLAGSDLPFLWVLEDAERYVPDHVVYNNGTTEELYSALTDVLNIERSKRA